MRVFAPAKINLFLHVGPQQADHYHPLESIAVFADLGDVLHVSPAQSLSFEAQGLFAAGIDPVENSVLAAARALACEPKRGAAIILEKHLPIAAGLGGGSADAAAALIALSALWGMATPLAPLARQLGADVPVCLAAEPAFMSGIGHDFEVIDLPDLHAVLVNPGAPAPTQQVYRAFDALGGGGDWRPLGAPPDLGPDPIAALADLRNDLTAAAICVAPIIAEALAVTARAPKVRLVRLSGSGATVFGLFDAAAEAEAAARMLSAEKPDWWVRAARLGFGRR